MNVLNELNFMRLWLLFVHFIFSMSHPAASSDTTGITACKANGDDAFTAPSSGNVVAKWVSISLGGNLVLHRPEPAGIEESNPIYLCRGKANNNRNKPGKLLIKDGNYHCIIPEWGEIRRDSFEMLETPVGATSWIPYKNSVPNNAIVAGTNSDRTKAYICRATNAGALLVGTLHGASHGCYVPRAGKEHVIWSNNSNVEIFVLNAYGLRL